MRAFFTLLALVVLAASTFAGTFRVFYNVPGDKRLAKGTEIASSEEEIRCWILQDHPKAYNIVINRMADLYPGDGKGYILRPEGSTAAPDLVHEGKAYVLFDQ